MVKEQNATTYKSKVWVFRKAVEDRVEIVLGRIAIIFKVSDDFSLR